MVFDSGDSFFRLRILADICRFGYFFLFLVFVESRARFVESAVENEFADFAEDGPVSFGA